MPELSRSECQELPLCLLYAYGRLCGPSMQIQNGLPEEGRFEFAWMDRIIDRMHKAGIKVILGTPTYSIPAWMAKKYPELFIERLDGSKSSYGIRQNFDLSLIHI